MQHGVRSYSLSGDRSAIGLHPVQANALTCRRGNAFAHQRKALNSSKGDKAMDKHTNATTPPNELADDILRGADEIAEFIFGKSKSGRRKVYYLVECCRLPVFRLGAVLCARRSVLLKWISTQENRAFPSSG